MFVVKVDAQLAFSRWLMVGIHGAEARLDTLYEQWALKLLGGQSWRNSAVVLSERGWTISGYARAVRDAAMRLARISLQPSGGLYRKIFELALLSECG